MKYFVYYLYSPSLDKHYLGKSDNLKRRIVEHNSGEEIYTKRGIPWKIIGYIECKDNIQASRLERKLKKSKNPKYIKWFFEINGIMLKQ